MNNDNDNNKNDTNHNNITNTSTSTSALEEQKRTTKLLFLIGESRGGSTYTYDTLNLHPSITMIGQEPLYTFSNTVCNNNELLRRINECTFENWLTHLYQHSYDKLLLRVPLPPPKSPNSRQRKSNTINSINDINSINIVGTKINIEQIPPEFYPDLSVYLSCLREQAVILHVTRASAIASFWNYQAEVPERLAEQNWRFTAESLPKGLETPLLELDPELAAEWVHARDALSQDLFSLFSFGVVAQSSQQSSQHSYPLRYQRVYYEHLKDDIVGDDYWRSVFAFLGVDSSRSVQRMRRDYHYSQRQQRQKQQLRTHNKTHGATGTTCHQRIANWPEVKEALLGGTTGGSLSVLACEHYS
jgi:hypothetical protein